MAAPCLHRFCRACINNLIRLSRRKECPNCRCPLPTRRALRRDDAFARLSLALFPSPELLEESASNILPPQQWNPAQPPPGTSNHSARLDGEALPDEAARCVKGTDAPGITPTTSKHTLLEASKLVTGHGTAPVLAAAANAAPSLHAASKADGKSTVPLSERLSAVTRGQARRCATASTSVLQDTPSLPAPKPSRCDNVYTVTELLDRRRDPSRRLGYQYLVKWEGFGDEHNTWEPESNVRRHMISDSIPSSLTRTHSRKVEHTFCARLSEACHEYLSTRCVDMRV